MPDAAPFSFAIIADTHLEADPGAVANVRCARLVEAIRRRAPAFVLHLGDVVHPLPGAASHAGAAALAETAFAFGCPVLTLPGNHDIGDKPLSGQPAKRVRASFLATWRERYGPDAFVHDVGPLRIVAINAPLLADDDETVAGLEAFLAQSLEGREGRRLVLATHYPLFLHEEAEPSSYDNIVPTCREVLLDYCRINAVEAVFSGHIHNYFRARRGPTHFHGAPSSAFLRRDWSELYRTAALAEHGREDPFKLGFLWVTVTAAGMAVDMVALTDLAAFEADRLPLRVNRSAANLGANLRHDWAEVIELPINPPTGTFSRRRLRDDYTMRMILELGLGVVRVPAADLLAPERRRRAADLRDLGVRVHAFTDLEPHSRQLLAEVNGSGIDTLELIVPQTPDAPALVARFLAGLDLPAEVAVGYLEDYEASPPAYQHAIGYGVLPSPADFAMMREALPEGVAPALVAAFPVAALDGARVVAAAGVAGDAALHLLLERQSADTTAATGDATYPILVERALRLAEAHPRVSFILDTFCEFDRGYHVRTGLVDRTLNPTPAGDVLRLRRPETSR